MNVVDALPDSFKKSKGRPPKEQDNLATPRGRPKGSGKLTMAKYADAKPLAMLPKTENQRVKELKDLLINSAGVNVVQKTVQIALDDDHPAQMAALKLCMDRMLPVTLFEKEKNQRSAVNITISGIGGINIVDTPTIEAEDIESKDV
jgi:predicted dinucleotide-utilizing enzyme